MKRYFISANTVGDTPSIGDVSFEIVSEDNTQGQNIVGEYPTDESELSIKIRARMLARLGNNPKVHKFLHQHNLPI